LKLRNSTQQIIGGKQTNTNKSSSLSLITFTFCSINLVQLDNGQLVGCPPDGPCNDQEEQYICTDYSFWADVYDGNNSGTGNSGGSGDSGGGGDDGVPPPCNGSGRLSNVINPCSPGWEPVEDVDVPSYDPCEDIQKRAKKIDTIYAKGKIDSLIGTIPNFATETKEKGFPTIQNFSIYPFPPRDTTFGNFHIHNTIYTGTDSNIHYNFTYNNLQVHVASTHTHPPKGYPAPSADDVYNLINDMLQDSYCQTFFVYASNGSKYALTINNYNQALAFWTTKSKYLNGAKWNEDSTVGKSFKEATKYFFDKYDGNPNQENLAYEMAMAAVLSKFNTGITLNKQDVSGNFKPIIVTQVTDPKKHKRTIYSQECL
jgi:hypothetical protein